MTDILIKNIETFPVTLRIIKMGPDPDHDLHILGCPVTRIRIPRQKTTLVSGNDTIVEIRGHSARATTIWRYIVSRR